MGKALWHSGLWSIPPRGCGIRVNKIENAGLVPGAPGANFGIRVYRRVTNFIPIHLHEDRSGFSDPY